VFKIFAYLRFVGICVHTNPEKNKGKKQIACTLFQTVVTLHSWAGILDGRYDKALNLELLLNDEKYVQVRERIRTTHCLIIDESSMISKSTFEKVEYLCRKIRKNNFVFGKIQIIGSGDFFQLCPVPNTLYGDSGQSCLQSSIFHKVFPHHISLPKVIRQNDMQLIKAISELEKGETLSSDTLISFIEKHSRPIDSNIYSPVYLYARNVYADLHNAEILESLPGEFTVYDSKDAGSPHYLGKILAPSKLALKDTAKVMLLKNIDKTLLNGMVGYVVKLDTDEITVNFDNKCSTIKPVIHSL